MAHCQLGYQCLRVLRRQIRSQDEPSRRYEERISALLDTSFTQNIFKGDGKPLNSNEIKFLHGEAD
jgi:hypothetical protein